MIVLEGCVPYIFAGFLFKTESEYLWNLEKYFSFHLKSSCLSQENYVLEFYILKFHDVIKWLTIKQELYFTEWLGK